MNIYFKKQIWKILLLSTAVAIGVSSLLYTNNLVEKLAGEEKKKVKLWAQGTKKLGSSDLDTKDLTFLFSVVRNNTTVPVILIDDNDSIKSWRNLPDSVEAASNPKYRKEQLEIMKSENSPIVIPLADGREDKIYFANSILLKQLKFYPYVQLGIISLFIIVAYLAFSASRNAEQNQVWVGMAKETAHQLGTPLSSLLGWLEYLRADGLDDDTYNEITKDIKRLETITDRFSKIGAVPKLEPEPINLVLENSVNYLKSRVSDKVHSTVISNVDASTTVPLNKPLFEWVIENIFKNGVDAMNGEGNMKIEVSENAKSIFVDISDTGKGIPKTEFKTVFRPGFTTKTRGWGLGLSLVKRIVEYYHEGKIYVMKSEIGKGTTFRIELNKH